MGQDNLFSAADAARRERLLELGWVQQDAEYYAYWLRPDGASVTEEEAFRQLDSGTAEFKEPKGVG